MELGSSGLQIVDWGVSGTWYTNSKGICLNPSQKWHKVAGCLTGWVDVPKALLEKEPKNRLSSSDFMSRTNV